MNMDSTTNCHQIHDSNKLSNSWILRFDCALGWEDTRSWNVRKKLQLPECCAFGIGRALLQEPDECTVAPINFTFAVRICDPAKKLREDLTRTPVSFLAQAINTCIGRISSDFNRQLVIAFINHN